MCRRRGNVLHRFMRSTQMYLNSILTLSPCSLSVFLSFLARKHCFVFCTATVKQCQKQHSHQSQRKRPFSCSGIYLLVPLCSLLVRLVCLFGFLLLSHTCLSVSASGASQATCRRRCVSVTDLNPSASSSLSSKQC